MHMKMSDSISGQYRQNSKYQRELSHDSDFVRFLALIHSNTVWVSELLDVWSVHTSQKEMAVEMKISFHPSTY